MSDVALIWSNVSLSAQFAIEANDLQTDGGLETAILISLFTDRRAEDGDVLPEGETDRKGWWADEFAPVDGDKIGSRLWLLKRSKQTPQVLSRADEYAHESLQWLLEDRVCDRIEFDIAFPRRGQLLIAVTPFRPKRDPITYRFNHTWASQEAQRP